jgi:hypothetical protein
MEKRQNNCILESQIVEGRLSRLHKGGHSDALEQDPTLASRPGYWGFGT